MFHFRMDGISNVYVEINNYTCVHVATSVHIKRTLGRLHYACVFVRRQVMNHKFQDHLRLQVGLQKYFAYEY